MKSTDFLTEGVTDVANSVIDHINSELKTMFGINVAPFTKQTDSRVWTRGDGRRYKAPPYIYVPEYEYKHLVSKYPEVQKRFPTREKMKSFAIETFIAMPGVKYIGEVSDEFASLGYDKAYKYKGVVFVCRRSGIINYSSPSIFRNSGVWKKK